MALQSFESDFYRYGFQGQEKDDDFKGKGNSYNYKYRIHDVRLGRFFSTDPLAPAYVFLSPYQFASNNVIGAIELEGLEAAEEIVTAAATATAAGEAYMYVSYSAMAETSGSVVGSVMSSLATPLAFVTCFITPVTVGGPVSYDPTKVYNPDGTIDFIASYERQKEILGDVSSTELVPDNIIDDNLLVDKKGVTKTKGGGLYEISADMTSDDKSAIRKSLAEDFYASFNERNIESKVSAIDLTQPVQTVILKEGEIIQQWVDPKRGPGKYFSPEGSGNQIGVPDMDGRVLKTFKILKDTKVLKSVTGEYDGAAGGDVQYFSPELIDNTIEFNETKYYK